jgi:hypothetical protein
MSTAFQAWAESFWRKNGRYPMQHEVWEAASQRTEQQEPVYLVATGETHEGLETYTRHEGAPPPLCDSERLFAHPPAAEPKGMEPMARFCPGCGSVGPVDAKYRDCCPDGSKARMVPAKFAEDCHDLFKLAIRGRHQATAGAPAMTDIVKLKLAIYRISGGDFDATDDEARQIALAAWEPAARVPLNEDRIIHDIWAACSPEDGADMDIVEFARAIEAAHGIGTGGKLDQSGDAA